MATARRAEERSLLLESTREGIFVVDTKGVVTLVIGVAAAMTAYDRGTHDVAVKDDIAPGTQMAHHAEHTTSGNGHVMQRRAPLHRVGCLAFAIAALSLGACGRSNDESEAVPFEREVAQPIEALEPQAPAPTRSAAPLKLARRVLPDLTVDSYYGTYLASPADDRGAAESLEGPVRETWPPPPVAARPYRIAVLFPHLKDPYWLAVNYGIVAQAEIIGVSITLREAGGYGRLGDQRRLLVDQLSAEDVDGVILAAIDYERLDEQVAEVVAAGIPVIEVINNIRAPAIRAKALVSFFDMGYAAGRFVLEDAGGRDIKVAFFPGPEGSGWAPDTLLGFRKAIEDHGGAGVVEILEPQYGDTGVRVQRSRIAFVLERNQDVDYLVGNAVAAGAATDLLAKPEHRDAHPDMRIVSTYVIPEVYDKIRAGLIAAAPTDLTVDQGRMAVDMMVRLLNGETPGDRGARLPFRSGPVIQVVSPDTIDDLAYERLFGPRGFEAMLDYDPGP